MLNKILIYTLTHENYNCFEMITHASFYTLPFFVLVS